MMSLRLGVIISVTILPETNNGNNNDEIHGFCFPVWKLLRKVGSRANFSRIHHSSFNWVKFITHVWKILEYHSSIWNFYREE